jgi:RNA polymerase sigma factor FliA
MTSAAPEGKSRTLTRDEYGAYSPVIRRMAMWIARRSPHGTLVSELSSRGWKGLLLAFANRDAVLPSEFEAYAIYRIRAAMLDHLASLDSRIVRARAESRTLARTIRSLHEALGRAPTREEIRDVLGLSSEEYLAMLERLVETGLARLSVLDIDLPRAEERTTSEIDELPMEALASAIDALPQPGKDLLILIYQENCSLEESAAVLGTTAKSARLILAETLHRLRAALGKE